MKNLRQMILLALTGLSLLLCIATAALWVRGYWIQDIYTRATAAGKIDISSFRGGIHFTSVVNPRDKSASVNVEPGYHAVRVPPESPGALPASWSFAGFKELNFRIFGVGLWGFVIPCWALVLGFLILPVVAPALRARTRRRRRRLGLCIECGYDLRFSKERCPECGVVIA